MNKILKGKTKKICLLLIVMQPQFKLKIKIKLKLSKMYIFSNSSHLRWKAMLSNIIFKLPIEMQLHIKFEFI